MTVQVEMMSSNSVYVFSCSSSAGPIVSSVNGMTVFDSEPCGGMEITTEYPEKRNEMP